MRDQVHNVPARFRINEALLERVKARAKDQGMNLSEFVRLALRNELRASSGSKPPIVQKTCTTRTLSRTGDWHK